MALSLAFALLFVLSPTSAEAETRTLKLYYVHTGERAEITFKKNGRYVQSGLNKLNRFLRDWRRNEPTRMDPELFDVIWEAYKKVGGRKHIHVVSAYRSPATNEMLRRTRGGQAKKSQHTLGKAMDFYIPGVKLSKLREIGFKLQGGGVGYYPKSGSPFVHFDTGSVRAWPRMSRSQLTRIFPNGKTLHLPPDGKPLPGYKQALASYQSRKRKGKATAVTRTVSADKPAAPKNNKSLIATLFGGGADADEDRAEAAAPARNRERANPQPKVSVPDTPQTQIAALDSRSTPLPQSAPRPRVGTPQTVEPLIAMDSAPIALVALQQPRPSALVPLAQTDNTQARPGIRRRSATEIEAALNAVSSENALRRDTVRALIASTSQAELPVQAAMKVPLPVAAPRVVQPEQSLIELAALPVAAPRSGSSQNADVRIAVAYAPEIAPTPRVDEPLTPRTLNDAEKPLIEKSQRMPVPAEPSRRIIAAYDTGVKTTEKSSRAVIHTASIRPAPSENTHLIPADKIDPSRFGSWVTASVSITEHGRTADRPVFIQNALRQAPTEVYTDGFRKNAAPDSRRFFGKAVTFLTVARFDGGKGGDGKPLLLQLPLAN